MVKANQLIFRQLIKNGYSLENKKRVWDLSDYKLWYLTDKQTKAYNDIDRHKDYTGAMFGSEADLMKESMPEIIEEVLHGSPINVIDVASFDGRKAEPLIMGLSKKTKLRYCPLDTAKLSVNDAIKNIKKLKKSEVIKFKWNVSDFENLDDISSLLRDKKFRQNFVVFLGSIISNFEPHDILFKISEALEGNEDYMLLGAALRTDPRELVETYNHPLMDKFLKLVLLELGFNDKDVEFNVRYRNSRVEMVYKLKKDKEISVSNGKRKSINFREGDEIIAASSYRFTLSELKSLLGDYFKDIKFFTNKEKTWTLALCNK